MKSYKTWETVKLLTENPRKEFKLDDGSKIYNYKGIISCSKTHPVCMELNINDEWEEVLKPITWQEALEAWAKGKKVKSIFDNREFIYTQEDGIDSLVDFSDEQPLCALEILKGIWYILD